MRFALTGSVALSALLSVAASGPAAAQCAPDPAVPLDFVTCTGTDLDGFSSDADFVSIGVEPGAEVTAPGDAIELSGDTANVFNEGDVLGTGKGLDLGFDALVNNFGFIDAGDDGIAAGDNLTLFNSAFGFIAATNRGVDAGDFAGILNEGFINADNDAIRVGDSAVVENDNILFSFEQEGVDAGNDLTLNNFGIIDAGDEGVQAALRATILNEGTIVSFDDAIQVQGDGVIENTEDGVIASFENDAIDIDSGVVINAGQIISEGVGEAGIDVDEIEAEDGVFPSDRSLFVENLETGKIEGEFGIFVDALNEESQTVVNAGHISGLGGVAIDLGAGDDEVFALGGATFDGLVEGGSGFDTLGFGFDFDAFSVLNIFSDGTFQLASEELGGGAIQFANFEFFLFDDASLEFGELKSILPPTAIPLPASAPLLIGGIALFGWVARRRRRA